MHCDEVVDKLGCLMRQEQRLVACDTHVSIIWCLDSAFMVSGIPPQTSGVMMMSWCFYLLQIRNWGNSKKPDKDLACLVENAASWQPCHILARE